jgi:hypothetical protein
MLWRWKPEVDEALGECSTIEVFCASSISNSSAHNQHEMINDERHMIYQIYTLTNSSVELRQVSGQLQVN